MSLKFKIIYLNCCISTNTTLMSIADQEDEGTVIYTDNQICGRGQLTKKWFSSPYKNLAFSLLLKPFFLDLKKIFFLNKLISVAVISAISQFINKLKILNFGELKIKWPNDFYWKNNKIGGILIENQIYSSNVNYSIIGIGINVNDSNFDLKNIISIKEIINYDSELDQKTLFNMILESVKKMYIEYKENKIDNLEIRKKYLSFLFNYKEKIKFIYQKKMYEGILMDIMDDGYIVLKMSGKFNFFKPNEIKICV